MVTGHGRATYRLSPMPSRTCEFRNAPTRPSPTSPPPALARAPRGHDPRRSMRSNLRGESGLTPPLCLSLSCSAGPNRSILGVVDVSQLYATSMYWSFTMLMKSPHIGPDTWMEKLFSCLMVLLGLFVTTQLVAVVTQVTPSRAHTVPIARAAAHVHALSSFPLHFSSILL